MPTNLERTSEAVADAIAKIDQVLASLSDPTEDVLLDKVVDNLTGDEAVDKLVLEHYRRALLHWKESKDPELS